MGKMFKHKLNGLKRMRAKYSRVLIKHDTDTMCTVTLSRHMLNK